MVFCLIKEEDKVTVLSKKKKKETNKGKEKDQWVTEPHKKRREPQEHRVTAPTIRAQGNCAPSPLITIVWYNTRTNKLFTTFLLQASAG